MVEDYIDYDLTIIGLKLILILVRGVCGERLDSALDFLIILLTAVLDYREIVPEDLTPGHLVIRSTAVSHPLHVECGQVGWTRLSLSL